MPPKTIVKGGFGYYDTNSDLEYEKVSSDSELVAGRIASYGASTSYARLYKAGQRVIGVFDKQFTRGGYSGISGAQITYSDDYLPDGEHARILVYGPFKFYGCLKDGETVTKGDPLGVEADTGKVIAWVSGPLVAVSLQDSSPSSADNDELECLFIGCQGSGDYIQSETLTASSDVITLTHYPTFIEHVEAVTGTTTGAITISETVTSPAAGQCYLNRSAKTITFNATDAVATALVRYKW